jgi:hypothetical protein
MKALRLPTRVSAVTYFVRFRRPRDPPVFVSAVALLKELEVPSWPGRWVPVARSAGSFHVDFSGSGRTKARIGLRMMPPFPSSPLRFRTAGFPQYGSKAGLSDRAFPDPASVKLAPSIPVALIRFATTLRALRSSMGSPFSVGATCSVDHRHPSDVRRSTPGALAPVQVMLSWTIIT